jgi:hydroxymethylbilane synthase
MNTDRKELKLGTRGSRLALQQSGMVASDFERAHPGLKITLVPIKTTGDRVSDVALSKIGDRGLFVKEIEEALLDGRVDLAVHSMKDMPTSLPPGLCIACVPQRVSPLDCLVSLQYPSLRDLAQGAHVATGSLRRRAQLRALRPDLVLEEIRGNLPTRIRKLGENGWHATMLAHAGLLRLGAPVGDGPVGNGPAGGGPVRWNLPADWGDEVAGHEVWIAPLDDADFLPAVGQGALCIETREDDAELRGWLASLNDADTAAAVAAERAFMRSLQGGCQVPIAALARCDGTQLTMHGLVANPQGARILRASLVGTSANAESVGQALAGELLEDGADRILDDIRRGASAESYES